jgi:isopentenyldiphosphate isomerase
MTSELLKDDIEYIVHCEEDGKVIGPISKLHAHIEGVRSALCHYSTFSMVFHIESGKYGIQRKNPNKWDKRTAGKWDMGVAGHNCYVKDEDGYRYLDFEDNLIKESDEEIGIELTICKGPEELVENSRNGKATAMIIEKFNYKTDFNNEYVSLAFIIVPNTNVDFKDNEVVEFRWLSPDEMSDFLKNSDEYCSALPVVFEKAEKFRIKHLDNLK